MLNEYRVLDFTDDRGEIGPMILGDLGADVIRVEGPGGSPARRAAPLLEDAPADLASLQFLAYNRNKRSIMLDPDHAEDRKTLRELIETATFVFESSPGGTLSMYGIGIEDMRDYNPRIVHVRLSPFGSDGPRADFHGNDLVIAAMGGPVSLQGPNDRPPVRVSVPQVWRHAGIEAVAGALAAHARMIKTGRAQFVDLSAQSVMTWTMLQAMDAHAIQGFDFERDHSRMAGIEVVYRCRDGYIVALPMSNVVRGCLEWMIEDGVIDASARDMDWQAYDFSRREPNDGLAYTIDDMVGILARFFAKYDKKTLFDFGIANDITLTPVETIPGLLELEHLKVREYWHPKDLPTGATVRSPGAWVKSDRPEKTPVSVRMNAPGLDEHGIAIRRELEEQGGSGAGNEGGEPAPSEAAGDDALPFAGVKVADFAWVGVGPISSKYLADHGATVVRVESSMRPDVLRGGTPFKDGIQGWNRSQFFGDFNTSKYSLSLDMKSPESMEIARDLIRWSDVLIESFAPGAMQRMGLDYEGARAINPDIIMVSTCLMGQTGPARRMAGYGYHAAALAGFYELTGWPDCSPSGPWTAYTDTIAPRFGSVLLATALDRKRRTGSGCYIDLAQLEAALHFLAPEILEQQATGATIGRIGNRSRFAAPQGCYPCQGEDQWLAVAVETDAEWQALCEVIDAQDAGRKYPDNEARLAAHDAIDELVSAWSRDQSARDAMEALQAVGIPAGVVQRSSDLLADPQYEHRSFYRYLEHPEMGRVPYAGHQYRIGDYPNGPRRPAPVLGEHSYEVLSELLGLDEERIGSAFASGAIN